MSKTPGSDDVSAEAVTAPKIEFPCRYPIKIMGEATDGFTSDVLEIVSRHASDVSDTDLSTRASAKGNYLSLTVTINATGVAQLEALFADLKSLAAVRLVL